MIPGLETASTLIAKLGLAKTAGFQFIGDFPEAAELQLLPAEVEIISSATDNRRREFAIGRAAARLAADELGIELGAVGVGDKRQPLWPAAVTGSITHTRGFVMAALARIEDLGGAVGIDAEQVKELEPGVERRILTSTELERLAETDGNRAREVIRIFSAKEAFYKAQFQLTQRWVGFQDAETTPTEFGLDLVCESHEISDQLEWPQRVNVVQQDRLVISALVARPS